MSHDRISSHLRFQVGPQTSAIISADGPFGRTEISNLLRILTVQLEVLDDEAGSPTTEPEETAHEA